MDLFICIVGKGRATGIKINSKRVKGGRHASGKNVEKRDCPAPVSVDHLPRHCAPGRGRGAVISAQQDELHAAARAATPLFVWGSRETQFYGCPPGRAIIFRYTPGDADLALATPLMSITLKSRGDESIFNRRRASPMETRTYWLNRRDRAITPRPGDYAEHD